MTICDIVPTLNCRGGHMPAQSSGGQRLILIENLEQRLFMSADVVIEWDQVLINALRTDRTLPGPTWASRSGAMVHAAIFDAINSIDQSYTPYLTLAPAATGASVDAAAAAAGWRVLSAIYPDQQSTFDAALQTTLDRVPNGRAENAGVDVGLFCANAILAARANDGSNVVTPYTPGTDMGDWQPAPPGFGSALGVGWGNVTPFMMDAGSQFRPPPAPALTSHEYTTAYQQVKMLGAVDSKVRTPEQTQIGMFWGYDRAGMGAPPSLYNQITAVVAQQQHNSVIDDAKLFALTNMAMADSGIAAWDCKYVDNFWRPITAIRSGDLDGNPATKGDETWEPLGAPGGSGPNFTPPFPAYVSGHATFGAAVFQTLADFYGRDKIDFSATSDELPGVTRSFKSFSQAAAENGISRIYLGIHWSFDNTEGQKLGRTVADFAFAHALAPIAAPAISPFTTSATEHPSHASSLLDVLASDDSLL
jgi:hypothetical protein